MNKKFEDLMQLCKCSITLLINSHKDYYQSVEEYISDDRAIGSITDEEDLPTDVYNKMVELDTVIELQFYPETPIGFYKIYHYDYNEAIKKAFEILMLNELGEKGIEASKASKEMRDRFLDQQK